MASAAVGDELTRLSASLVQTMTHSSPLSAGNVRHLAAGLRQATGTINKLEAFTIRQARKKISRRLTNSNEFDRVLDGIPRDGLVNCNRFLYVLSHVLEDKAVRDLICTKETRKALSPTSSRSKSESSVASSQILQNLPLRSIRNESIAPKLSEATQSPDRREMESEAAHKQKEVWSSLSPSMSLARASVEAPESTNTDEICTDGHNFLVLSFGCKISLRSSIGTYAHVDDKASLACRSPNPSPLVLYSSLNRRDNAPMRFGDSVFVCAENGNFVSAETNGTVVVSSTSFDSRSKWVIVDALTQGSSSSSTLHRRSVRIASQIALKTCFGTFLHAGPDGGTHVNATDISAASTWQISKLSLPYMPDWMRNVALSHIVQKAPLPLPPSCELSRQAQELALIEAVLSALMGAGGQWIYATTAAEGNSFTFQLNQASAIDSSLQYMVTRLLPLCNEAAAARAFVQLHSRYEYGLVHHALSAAIGSVLQQLLVRVAQLEHELQDGELSLQRAWFYLQECMRALEATYKLLAPARKLSGGALLQLLYTFHSTEGDEDSRALYCSYLQHASVPYFHMLERWIYHGVIEDPYDEFHVKVRDDLCKENLERDFNDAYWDERYTTREEQVPSFVRASSERILRTGKYLNVIRQCGQRVQNPLQRPFQFTTDVQQYHRRIDDAFSFASHKLLTVLLEENQLIARLRSIKRYFLLSHGDFFVHFLDSAEEELCKNVDDIVSSKLESLLELSIRTSSGAALDPFQDDLTCYLQHYTVIQKLEAIHNMSDEHYLERLRRLDRPSSGSTAPHSMTVNGVPFTGLEAFTLDYNVRWPLSLVLSKKALTKYQLIFRHLFYIKHVERQLCNTWLEQQSMKELSVGSTFAQSYALRQRMLHFLQNLLFYMMVEVLEPNWHNLENKLSEVHTVDELLHTHVSFLDLCLKECLLTNHLLLKTLTKLLMTCLAFSNNIKSFSVAFKAHQPIEEPDREDVDDAPPKSSKGLGVHSSVLRRARLQAVSHHSIIAGSEKNYVDMVDEFGRTFDERLKVFMQQLTERAHSQYDSHLSNLCTRLDYNQFYATQQSRV